MDGLHLGSARELGDDLEGIVTYDGRLAEAVAMTGYLVVAPARAGGRRPPVRCRSGHNQA